MNKNILSFALIAGLTATACAGTTTGAMSKSPVPPTPEFNASLYQSNEWQIDLSGNFSFTDSQNRRLIKNHSWGGGLAVNYFFTRNLGLGFETSIVNAQGATLGKAVLNFYQRLPLGSTPFAIYAFEGGGFTYNADNLNSDNLSQDENNVVAEVHAGVGAEYRCTPHLSIFSDVRYTFEDASDSDFMTARTGIRIVF